MKLDLVGNFLNWRMQKRYHQIELFMQYPHQVQQEILFDLLDKAKNTYWGNKYSFTKIRNYQHFSQQLPLTDYESIEPWVAKLRHGEKNIFWPGEIKWFAKSSGTTSSKSKFIPVSQPAIDNTHFKGGKDLLSIYSHWFEDTYVFKGSNLRLGGSLFENNAANKSYYGDVSAIIIENLPFWVEMKSTPSSKVSLMQEWEAKIDAIVATSIQEDVASLAGVPSWMLVLLHKVLEATGKSNLHQVWPNLELYMHGGVSFGPYRKHFEALMGRPINYLETYNASEGFFGIQDQKNKEEMLLMLDYGIYYEFIPMKDFAGTRSKTIPLSQVQEGVNYALVISSNAGLWRYIIGDTVRFTSTQPYRIKITGRTKHFINVFGEEVIIENAENALQKTCKTHNAMVNEYTVGPIFMEGKQSGAHQWLIEFKHKPHNLEAFARELDENLQAINSDYEAKRYKNLALKPLQVTEAKPQLFYQWLKSKNRIGGQYKVPRLSNSRQHIEELLKLNT
jgi:hypothetical protein